MGKSHLKNLLAITLLMISHTCLGQGGSEIYLFDMKITEDNITISNGKNISNHPGYDNQPSFHPDKPILYYTTAVDTSGLTELVAYNYLTSKPTSLTSTVDREYSPTVTPDKKFISCIIQTPEGKQNLGKYPIDGGQPTIIVDNLTIGYHAWVDGSNLILFVLGEPHTLRWYSTTDKKDLVLAENIGRSLHKIPGSTDMSFVQKSKDGPSLIKRLKGKDGAIETITETLPEREDLTWTKDGKIIMSDGKKLFFFQDKKRGWKEIGVDSSASLNGITRLNVTKDGDKIAIVVAE